MVVVTSPLMREKVKNIVLNIENLDISFVKEEGINLFFNTDADIDYAISVIKSELKKDPMSGSIIIKVRKDDY